MSVVCVIPARGGSKGILGKNLKRIGNLSLIQHCHLQATASNVFDRIVLTSEDPEILDHARDSGIHTILRPDQLATDEATSPAVLMNALETLSVTGESYEYAVLMEVTSPLRFVSDVRRLVEELIKPVSSAGVVSVAASRDHPQQAFVWSQEAGTLRPFSIGSERMIRRQELDVSLHPFGGLYGVRVEEFRKDPTFYPMGVRGIQLQDFQALEIDSPHELEIARALYSLHGFGKDYL